MTISLTPSLFSIHLKGSDVSFLYLVLNFDLEYEVSGVRIGGVI